ncbi:MAG: histidine kinase [Ferruginibacter sp.]|nr:histidine kinase [Chitinophagaceae bacterium]
MIRDLYLRILLIPFLGVFLPLVAGIISYDRYPVTALILINLYFILTSFVIWTGCNWVHTAMRPLYLPRGHLLRRILPVCFACAVYGSCIGCLSALGWIQFSGEVFAWNNIISFILACLVTVVVFTLLYEILFLTKERERDKKMVNRMDRERSLATLYALQNEMDPHFLFNALNTLNHLIMNNPQQAHLYNNKLAQVYKYFLINKNKELISLENELDFIDDYFYLLQLRYDKKLLLEIQLNPESGKVMIPPCSLQILLENAIKHNSFSDEDPLLIVIAVNGQYIRVANKMKPKPYLTDSTQIGLNNLSSRYRLLFNKDIIISPGDEHFTVNLPIIRCV